MIHDVAVMYASDSVSMPPHEVTRAWAPGISARLHYFPVYKPRATAGLPQSCIDNRVDGPRAVVDGVLELARAAARCASIVLWPDARECWPEVARELPDLFETRILLHADDCVWSSPVRTFPVAKYFSHLIHWMRIYDQQSGRLVRDVYHAHGLPASGCYHGGYGPTGAHATFCQSFGGSASLVAARAAALVRGETPAHDLVFVGASAFQGFRADWLQHLNRVAPLRPRWLLHGIGMRDGALEPIAHPLGVGYPALDLMTRSLATLNIGLSSLYNNRLWDAWLTGTLQFVVDPHAELPAEGFAANEHYVAVESAEALVQAVQVWKQRHGDVARIVTQAAARAAAHLEQHDLAGTVIRILQDLQA